MALGVLSFKGDESHEVEVIFAEAGFPETLAVRDLWDHAELGRHEGRLTVPMEPHDGRLFRLTRAR